MLAISAAAIWAMENPCVPSSSARASRASPSILVLIPLPKVQHGPVIRGSGAPSAMAVPASFSPTERAVCRGGRAPSMLGTRRRPNCPAGHTVTWHASWVVVLVATSTTTPAMQASIRSHLSIHRRNRPRPILCRVPTATAILHLRIILRLR